MNILFLITSFFFFVWIVRNVLFWVNLWQIKEYRLDRMLVHLKETHQGRSLFLSWFLWIKIVVLFSYVFVIFSSNSLLLVYDFIVAFIFFIEFTKSGKEILSHTLKRPVITIKTLFLTAICLFIISFFYAIPLISDVYVWLLVLDRLIIVLIALLIFLLSFPTEMYKDYIVEKATEKLKRMNNLLVIGITGSYGKSSTKEYVAQVLSDKFHVVKTKGTNNTPIGIAKAILSFITPETEIFVVEMGAYKKGEIEELCNIVHPKIGILTAVSDQHLSLFGDIQKTMQAKYELIDALPKDGLAIFNGNNKNAEILFKQTRKQKVLYRTNRDTKDIMQNHAARKNEQIVVADMITVNKNSIAFRVKIKNRFVTYKTGLVGVQTVENILPAIFLGSHLGMRENEIQKSVARLTPLPQTMVLTQLKTGATAVNDSFNTNPHAVFAALEYMKLYKKKKILIFSPMIELGKKAHIDHYSIGKTASKLCDYIFLTNKNYLSSFMKGIREGGGKCIVEVGSIPEIIQFIFEHSHKDDLVIFEGKETGIILDKTIEGETHEL